MPILKREPDVFPEGIFDMPEPWFVAHVRSRQEKALARYLTHYEIAYYLPQAEKRVRRDGRNFVSHLPLFPGYAFFRGSDGSTSRALRSHLIVKLIAPLDQEALQIELKQLRDLQMSSGRLNSYPDLLPGDPVLITEGAFAGYRGVIVREKSTERLIVSISFIRQCVVVDIDRDGVRPQPLSQQASTNA